ncbi:hypothetical protein [Flavihumibacter sp. UBA7668]|uniref:hypothetical protein n=1 Tax=Flavihumibacter sp. UBA7668 TaxID=1946542 RepID=UPI0025C1B73D|nr:hypothetical protein [Flavihumibacter sp. UBA7668]
MEKEFGKLSGYSLLIGASLMVLTMVLHPSGGDMDHIVKISRMALLSHSIGVLSTVFTCFGFYGLATALITRSRLSILGLGFSVFALMAVLLAALLNGIVLPLYVLQQSNTTGPARETVLLIIQYGLTINAALAYTFIGGYTIAMLIWSFGMVKTMKFPKWLGYWGILLVLISLVAAFLQLNFISVTGFTIYVAGIVSWILISAYFLINFTINKTYEE